MKRQLGLKTKLIGLCLIYCALNAVVGGIGYVALNRVSDEYEHISQVNMPNLNTLQNMLGDYRGIRIRLRTLGLPGLTPEQGQAAIAEMQEFIATYEKEAARYEGLEFVPGEKELYEPTKKSWLVFKALGARVVEIYQGQKPGWQNELQAIFMKDCPEAAKAYTDDITKLIEFNTAQADMWAKSAHDTSDRAETWSLIVMIGGSASALLLGYLFALSLTRAFQKMTDHLSRTAGEVASASSQIASTSTSLSAGAVQQASAVEETMAAVQEITSMVERNVENADHTTSISQSNEEASERGRQAVEEMVQSITEINRSNDRIMEQIDDSNRQIAEIVNVISEIGNKTKVINDIVFQTKLLSFNASVEAARAGEHGKGFAVVAEEVGNLAQMSGNAAKEISTMLEESMRKVEGIVEDTKSKVGHLIEASRHTVEGGAATAQRCSQILEEIVGSVREARSRVVEIAKASKEQSQGVGQIGTAMSEINVTTQRTSNASEESAAAANQLMGQAESLHAIVNEFVLLVQGGRSAAPAPQGEPKEANFRAALKPHSAGEAA
ncbi:MAG: methyl-accepting chemotaxis protein [Bdellovibrionaceae bacterium]|nr:methyl-accepting chemotaxis protein [Pseudobdellovibrionaceae bacterium]